GGWQTEPEVRVSGPPPRGGPAAGGLLGGNGESPRSAEPADLGSSDRNADRGQLAEVSPRRPGKVRRRGACRVSPLALAQGEEAARVARRGDRARAVGAPG